MADEIGIAKHAPKTNIKTRWNYESLKYPPPEATGHGDWVTSIYRGLVPAKNIEKRDFAIAGAFVSDLHNSKFPRLLNLDQLASS